MTQPSIVITIPTYNEAENIGSLIDEILKVLPDARCVIIDDSSPDGTSRVVEQKIKEYPEHISLILRKENKGRGSAGRHGFVKALDIGADYIVEMDADFSHQPKFIPDLLKPLLNDEADITLGSRKADGGSDKRGIVRTAITSLAGRYIRLMLGTSINDVTSGFRAYTREALLRIDPSRLRAIQPDIVEEVLYKAIRARLRIKEVGIVFEDRKKGKSTFNRKIMQRVLTSVIKLRFRGKL